MPINIKQNFWLVTVHSRLQMDLTNCFLYILLQCKICNNSVRHVILIWQQKYRCMNIAMGFIWKFHPQPSCCLTRAVLPLFKSRIFFKFLQRKFANRFFHTNWNLHFTAGCNCEFDKAPKFVSAGSHLSMCILICSAVFFIIMNFI